MNKRTFFDLFNTYNPVLKVKLHVDSDEEAIEVQIVNKLEKRVDTKGLKDLERICSDVRLSSFVDFYSKCNGFSLGKLKFPWYSLKKPLLKQLPVSDLTKFTKKYLPNGKRAWTIDLNKSKAIYRNEQKWLAFAEVDGGAACLTIFLNGENAGNIYLVTPQPHFNILKPIAKTFNEFLDRIAKDPAAFFKLTRVYITITGKDNQSYGYVPIEYIENK